MARSVRRLGVFVVNPWIDVWWAGACGLAFGLMFAGPIYLAFYIMGLVRVCQ